MGSQTVPALIRRLCDTGNSPSARDRAGSALAAIGEPAVDALCLCLDDSDAVTRGLAADALGVIGCARALPYLLGACEDGDWAVRVSVVTALGRFGDSEIVEPLCRMLGDPIWSVGAAAAGALHVLRDVRSLRALLHSARDGHSMVRRASLRALKELGCGLEVAERVLAESRMTPDERRAAMEEMSRFHARDRGEALAYAIAPVDAFCRERLQHPDPAVRDGARRVLESGSLLRPSSAVGGLLLRPFIGSRSRDDGTLVRPAAPPTDDPERADE